ncbi:MAG: hypothetical protein ABGW81_08065 [Paracoccaceae bacterium]
MRQYWIPAALSEELHGERPIVPVTLMGKLLVLFCNEDGDLGLVLGDTGYGERADTILNILEE